jgi:hypothetical protein
MLNPGRGKRELDYLNEWNMHTPQKQPNLLHVQAAGSDFTPTSLAAIFWLSSTQVLGDHVHVLTPCT